MKIIGITGGVGAGKSTVLHILKELCKCEIIMADDEAKAIMYKGGPLTKTALSLFGNEAYLEDGSLNRQHIAQIIYNDIYVMNEWNNAVHPAVNDRINCLIQRAAKSKENDYVFIEAALLIENGYESICDEIWYVYADEATRIKRLMVDRGYSSDKSRAIMDKQMKDDEFRKKCSCIIDTSVSLEYTRSQLENRLEQY